ncbi:phosphoribosylglycinamide formyltransferase [Enterobacter cancerogenus]|uniref:Phosphoribosylglycinamide formyltransferase n=1 Tax=Enterobacter cancerogenus TaxID=69218 RepID=A0A484Z3M3_9ENTR|nr:phosphoribosylglycinamide formyltransferase [Enterobacter cancerogenus]
MKNIVVLISGNGSNLAGDKLMPANRRKSMAPFGQYSATRPTHSALNGRGKRIFPRMRWKPASFPGVKAFDRELVQEIDAYAPDVVVLAGYMRILSPAFVSHYAGRLLNIHPSLLPKYPGLHTHRQVLENGDEEHGTSVHFVTDELDGGPVILQAKVPVFEGDNEDDVTERVQTQEHAIYPLVVSWFVDGRLVMRDGAAWLDGVKLPPQGYAAEE